MTEPVALESNGRTREENKAWIAAASTARKKHKRPGEVQTARARAAALTARRKAQEAMRRAEEADQELNEIVGQVCDEECENAREAQARLEEDQREVTEALIEYVDQRNEEMLAVMAEVERDDRARLDRYDLTIDPIDSQADELADLEHQADELGELGEADAD